MAAADTYAWRDLWTPARARLWLLAGAVGWLVLLMPAALLVIPCRRVALHARALAWYAAQPVPVAWESAPSP